VLKLSRELVTDFFLCKLILHMQKCTNAFLENIARNARNAAWLAAAGVGAGVSDILLYAAFSKSPPPTTIY